LLEDAMDSRIVPDLVDTAKTYVNQSLVILDILDSRITLVQICQKIPDEWVDDVIITLTLIRCGDIGEVNNVTGRGRSLQAHRRGMIWRRGWSWRWGGNTWRLLIGEVDVYFGCVGWLWHATPFARVVQGGIERAVLIRCLSTGLGQV
jgi:hypothetical protein